jgi:hypothetical protein
MPAAYPKSAPLKTMRFRFGSEEEEVILRINLPAPETFRWTPRSKKLFVEAVDHGLMAEGELQEKYGVSLAQLKHEKPVSSREAKGRTRPAWVDKAGYQPIAYPDKGVVQVGDIKLDLDRSQLALGTDVVPLRPVEQVLLSVFMFHAGVVVTKSQALYVLAERGFYPSTNTFDGHLSFLRKRLGDRSSCLQTHAGVGYIFQIPS